MTRIVISGYYGFDNAGDEAMLASIVTNLRGRWPSLDVVVLSANPERTTMRHDVRSINRVDLRAITRELRGAGLLLSGGGSLLQDTTSPYTIAYYLGVVRLALLVRTRVMFFAQGIGPVRHAWNRVLMRRVMRRAAYITVRDRGSAELLKQLGIAQEVPVELTADAVLATTPGDALTGERLLREENISVDDRPLVGLSVRDVGGNSAHVDAIAEACLELSRHTRARFLVVPMQTTQDGEISRRLAGLLGQEGLCLSRTFTSRELSSIFARCQLVVGMRLHSLILSVVARTPVAGVSYDPKIEGFLELLGLKPLAAVHGPATIDADELAAGLIAAWNNRDELRDSVWHHASTLRRAALRNFDVVGELLSLPVHLA